MLFIVQDGILLSNGYSSTESPYSAQPMSAQTQFSETYKALLRSVLSVLLILSLLIKVFVICMQIICKSSYLAELEALVSQEPLCPHSMLKDAT